MICSDCKLQAELRNIFSILLMNGHPDHVIEKAIARKLKTFTSLTSHTVKNLFSSALVGSSSVRLENKIKPNVEKCFFAVEQRAIFTSRPLLPASKKDVLPASLFLAMQFIIFHATVIVGT